MRFIDPTGMGPDDFVNGVVTGVQNVVKGIANAVEDPVQTIKTVKDNITVEDVVCSVLLTPAGNTLLNAGKAIYNDIDGGDGSNTGEFVGESAANATLGAGLVLLTDGVIKTANIKLPVMANVVKNSGDAIKIKTQELSIAEQAANLSNRMNKNTLIIGDLGDGVKMQYDFLGATHKGVPTPHIQMWKLNVNPENGAIHYNKVSKFVIPMTQEHINFLDNYLYQIGF